MATSKNHRPGLGTRMSSSGLNGANDARGSHMYRGVEKGRIMILHRVRKRRRLSHVMGFMLIC